MLQLQPSQSGKPDAVSWTIARISRGASEGITNHFHFPGAQVRELQIINIFKVMIKMEQPGTINIHKPSQACRVLSLENGTVVKQGVSPRGLCQGILLIIDH